MDIFGNEFNEVHPLHTPHILVTFQVSHLDISGNEFNDSHPVNI